MCISTAQLGLILYLEFVNTIPYIHSAKLRIPLLQRLSSVRRSLSESNLLSISPRQSTSRRWRKPRTNKEFSHQKTVRLINPDLLSFAMPPFARTMDFGASSSSSIKVLIAREKVKTMAMNWVSGRIQSDLARGIFKIIESSKYPLRRREGLEERRCWEEDRVAIIRPSPTPTAGSAMETAVLGTVLKTHNASRAI